eukprot:245610_1
MLAWLILHSITTISINTTAKIFYAVSTWFLSQIHPIQHIKFTIFADSPSFEPLYKKLNAENRSVIFENSTPTQIEKLYSPDVNLSSDEPFMKIGNILRDLYAPKCSNQKNAYFSRKSHLKSRV